MKMRETSRAVDKKLQVNNDQKSLMAEAVAKELNVPLIKLDISNILSGVVGASETRIKQALTQVRQMAPAVLFIDEVEKCIGGIASSNASDSGVISRVVEALLDFMTSDTNVFVIMTSNDASNLPSELTRPGRLDTQWFFGFPTEDERKEIFKIHLNVYDQRLTGDAMDKAIEKTSDFTGAEIELSVKAAIRKAYKRFSSEDTETRILVTEDDILSSISEIVPIKNYAKEQVRKLEEYARNRARRTSTVSNNEVDIVSGFDAQQIEAVIPTKNVVRN